MAHSWSSSTSETEAWKMKSLRLPVLQSVFKAILDYIEGLCLKKLSKQIKNQEDNKTKYFVSTIQGLDSQSNKYSWRDNCLIGKQISENYPNISVRQISWRNKKKRKTIVKCWGLAKVNSGYHIVQKFHKSSGMKEKNKIQCYMYRYREVWYSRVSKREFLKQSERKLITNEEQ